MSTEDVGTEALVWLIHNYPEASVYHRAAFVNSVTWLVNGKREGLGGPSLRERLVVWKVEQDKSLPRPGNWKFEDACKYAAKYCFTPAEDHTYTLTQIILQEDTYDDDPQDIKALRD